MATSLSSSGTTPTGGGPKAFRWFFYGLLVAGAGIVFHSRQDLAAWAFAREAAHGQALIARPMPGGALVICGGGRLPDQVRDRFLELAGGPKARIVVIPTAHAYADSPAVSAALEFWKGQRIASVELFHTRSREKADDPLYVHPLTVATGVWLGGGRQEKLTEAYLGTEVERQLKALLDRGGVIGGTSAGAAVMCRVMITSGREKATLGEGFDFLPGAVIDQHYLKRSRIKRLLGVLRQHPDLVGLGIDEQTALVVDIRGHRANVIGNSYVFAYTCDSDTAKKEGTDESSTPCVILNSGDEADLAGLRKGEGAVIRGIDKDSLGAF